MLTQKIERTIKEINEEIRSDKEIFKILKNICRRFCIKHFSLAIFYGKESTMESFFLYSTYSSKWVHQYKERKYHLCDPIFNCLQKIAYPFEWKIKGFKNLTPLQSKLMKEAYEFGIRSGITIPLLPQVNSHGFLTILNQTSLHPDILYTLSLVANACSCKIMEMKKGEFLTCLTKREREVIFQKSQGLTVKNVSIKLRISRSTAAFHLTNIRKKLGVQTTEYAVSKFLTHTDQLIKPQSAEKYTKNL